MITMIKNCLITNSDAKVLRQFCIDKSDPLYKQYKGYNTSINLEAHEIYNGYTGRVVMITGDRRIGFEVVVLLNLDQAIKYGNLKSVDVTLNQDIDIGEKIGEVKNWVKIEYMTTNSQNQFPFRVLNTQMYKADPLLLLDFNLFELMNTSPQFSESGLIAIEEEFDGGFDINNPEFDTDNGWDD